MHVVVVVRPRLELAGRRHEPLRVADRIVLTKLDEAVSFGMLVSVVRRIGRRLSWVTTGQEVPADIETATGRRIADMMLGGVVKA